MTYVAPPTKPDDKASAADKAKYDADMKAWSAPESVAKNVDAVAQTASRSYYSINFVWTLVAGFLVMFMQAGFALVETGLIRAKNAAHTMSMNFMVYALGMFGFFVCGFAFMCGGLNGTAIGGPGDRSGAPTLPAISISRTPSVTRRIKATASRLGLSSAPPGFFLTGAGYDAGRSSCSSS